MSQVVLDIVPGGAKSLGIDLEGLGDLGLWVADLQHVAEAVSDERRGRALAERVQDLVENVRARVPAERHVIALLNFRVRRFKTVLDRLPREAGPVLHPLEAFLLSGGHELAVDEDRRGGVSVVGINSKNDHGKTSISEIWRNVSNPARSRCHRPHAE